MPIVVSARLLQLPVIGLICIFLGMICGYVFKRIYRRSRQDLESRLTRLERVATEDLPLRIGDERIANVERRLGELQTDLTSIHSEVRQVQADVNDLAADLATIEKFRTSPAQSEGKTDLHAVPTADFPAVGYPVAAAPIVTREENQIRIADLARELEVEANSIMNYLSEAGVIEGNVNSSSVDLVIADKVRKHFRHLADAEAAPEEQAAAEIAAVDRTSTTRLLEDEFIRAMVLVLRLRPDEWVTFGRLSRLLAIPGCDKDYVAAFAEYRPDLFAIGDDRSLKLHHNVIEEITRVGMQNWQVRPRRESWSERAEQGNGAGRSSGSTAGGCYCNSSYDEILNDLKRGAVPEEALVSTCCWTTICRVRGLHPSLVNPETWREICQRRGYLQQRENPRGF